VDSGGVVTRCKAYQTVQRSDNRPCCDMITRVVSSSLRNVVCLVWCRHRHVTSTL